MLLDSIPPFLLQDKKAHEEPHDWGFYFSIGESIYFFNARVFVSYVNDLYRTACLDCSNLQLKPKSSRDSSNATTHCRVSDLR